MGVAKHRNNFDALRLSAAVSVMVSHVFPLSGRVEPRVAGYTLGTLAVFVFFSISGYLVTRSWQADPSVWRFTVKRTLRIAPAYIVTVAMTWLAFQAAGMTNFASNPVPLVNGSLWTIPLEVQCYVLLLTLCALTRVGPLCFAIVALSLVAKGPFAEFAGLFAASSLIAAYRPPPHLLLGIVVAGSVILLSDFAYVGLLLIIAPAVVLIGTASWPAVSAAGRWGDVSYGTYLIAYPAQQVVILLLGPERSPVLLLMCAIAMTLPLAWLSWQYVERPALQIKAARMSAASRIPSPSAP